MKVATLGRAVLLIALTSVCDAVANGAEIETLKIGSAPTVLGPLEVKTEGKEKKMSHQMARLLLR
jgi:hypothetical protein